VSTASDCYRAARYWDLAFRDETLPEADFIEAAAQHWGRESSVDVLDIGCGGGRQLLELSRRGWRATGLDNEPAALEFARRRLQRAGFEPRLIQADMQSFDLPLQFDVAHCLVNTFRHLTTEDEAVGHLRSVAGCLKSGGLYLLGFHLLPPDALELDCERWSVKHRNVRVTTTVRVLQFCRRTRLETVRFSLKVSTPSGVQRFRSDHSLRIYTAAQFRRLLQRARCFTLPGVYDFCYDLHAPRELNNELGDAVFVLKKR
jgi:SAM-dependent methyltransferase